ncbi:MAG: DsbA family protein, partial [Hyphomicrobiaceae bacterium]|nr:DsbA family protein [Hyphomicrobiaceae bacterium]
EFASTYSFLTALRMEGEAEKRGVALIVKPFLLGPIFVAKGWNTSPFVLDEAKGRYMVRDIERRAHRHGLPPFHLNAPFPVHSVAAARLALVALEEGWGMAAIKALFTAQHSENRSIADPKVLDAVISALSHAPERLRARMNEADIKDRLRANSDEAAALGLIGAPSFVTADGEIFWGDDRLEDALDWAAGKKM